MEINLEIREKQKEIYDELLKSFKMISIGIIFYIIDFNITIVSSKWSLMTIGHVMVFTGLFPLMERKLYGKWVYIAIGLCSIHILSDIIGIFGFSEQFYFDFQILELICILFIYLNLTKILPFFNEFSGTVTLALTFEIIVSCLIGALLLSLPLMAWVTLQLNKIDLFKSLMGWLGATLSVLFLMLIAAAVTTYVSFSIYGKLKKSTFDEVIPVSFVQPSITTTSP